MATLMMIDNAGDIKGSLSIVLKPTSSEVGYAN